jgi:tRNA(Arg) A34 adenosine deaminase TadA
VPGTTFAQAVGFIHSPGHASIRAGGCQRSLHRRRRALIPSRAAVRWRELGASGKGTICAAQIARCGPPLHRAGVSKAASRPSARRSCRTLATSYTGPRDAMDHAMHMRRALQQAALAMEAGDLPIGAVVVHKSTVVAVGRNAVDSQRNDTHHAELVAIRASPKFLFEHKHECTIYTTLESCMMCMGAIINVGISRSSTASQMLGSAHRICLRVASTTSSKNWSSYRCFGGRKSGSAQ